MSEPIVEQIAQWLLAALQEITVANGYQYDLHVSRPVELDSSTESIGDLTLILEVQGREHSPGKSRGTVSPPKYRWRQLFLVRAYMVPDAGTSIDTKILRIIADIERRIGVETAANRKAGVYCGGLAFNIEVLTQEIAGEPDRNMYLLTVPIAADYEVSIENPYEQ